MLKQKKKKKKEKRKRKTEQDQQTLLINWIKACKLPAQSM
jgi:hypothetical protein